MAAAATYRARNAGRKRDSLMSSAAAPTPKAAAHSTNSAAYCAPCVRSCAATSAKRLHFCGATAIHLMLPPLANNATATDTKLKPIQMAHQSSWRSKSCHAGRRMSGGDGERSAISAMVQAPTTRVPSKLGAQGLLVE